MIALMKRPSRRLIPIPSFLLSDNFLDGPQDPVWAFTFHHTMGIMWWC